MDLFDLAMSSGAFDNIKEAVVSQKLTGTVSGSGGDETGFFSEEEFAIGKCFMWDPATGKCTIGVPGGSTLDVDATELTDLMVAKYMSLDESDEERQELAFQQALLSLAEKPAGAVPCSILEQGSPAADNDNADLIDELAARCLAFDASLQDEDLQALQQELQSLGDEHFAESPKHNPIDHSDESRGMHSAALEHETDNYNDQTGHQTNVSKQRKKRQLQSDGTTESGSRTSKRTRKQHSSRPTTTGRDPLSDQDGEEGMMFETRTNDTDRPAGYDKKGNPQYVVEKILDERETRKNGLEYLVKWSGFSARFNRWIAKKDMFCPDLIEDFKKRNVPKQHVDKSGKTKS